MRLPRAKLNHVIPGAWIVVSLTLFSLAGPGSRAADIRLFDINPVTKIWIGPDEEPLPFQNGSQVLDFLRTASVKSMKPIGSGVTGAKRLVLEKDGIVARAAFRHHRQSSFKALMADGTYRYNFRDDALFEVAAYRLSRALGLDTVPPTVERIVRGQRGSVQMWLEGVMTEGKRLKNDLQPPAGLNFYRQMQNMRVFDSLIYNEDRNLGNILIDKNWKVWMIDHTRSFRRYGELFKPEKILGIDAVFWERLRNLEEEQLKALLSPFVRPQEIRGLLKRRIQLVRHINELIAEKGEKRVVFSM